MRMSKRFEVVVRFFSIFIFVLTFVAIGDVATQAVINNGIIGCSTAKSMSFTGVDAYHENKTNRDLIIFGNVGARDLFGRDFRTEVWVPVGNVSVIVSPVDKRSTTITYWPTIDSRVFGGTVLINANRVVILTPSQSDKEYWQKWLEEKITAFRETRSPRRVVPPLIP